MFYSKYVIFLFCFLLFSCNSNQSKQLNTAYYDQLLSHEKSIIEYASHSLKQMGGSNGLMEVALFTSAEVDGSGGAEISEGNTQEKGVAEGDRQLNDSKSLFALSVNDYNYNQALTSTPAMMVWDLESGVLKQQLVLPEYHFELFKHNNNLLSLSGSADWGLWFDFYYWGNSKTSLQWYSQQSDQSLEKKNLLQIEGKIVRSVRVKSNLYTVIKYSPNTLELPNLYAYNDEPKQSENYDYLISKLTLEQLTPNWYLNGEDQGELMPASDCHLLSKAGSNYYQLNLMFIVNIDMADSNSRPKASCVIGNVETVYSSTNAIYMATTDYDTSANREINSNTVAQWIPPNYNTQIHRFDMNADGTSYRGSGVVDGYIIGMPKQKAFRLSQRDNQHLAVITFVGHSQASNTSRGKLSVLKFSESSTEAVVVSTLPNEANPESIGKPGEQLYASRYTDKFAYLVTFDKVDPLYAINIEDVNNPVKTSELEVTGFSDYLHPLTNNNFILGVGKEAEEAKDFQSESGGFSWYLGVKLSLFEQDGDSLTESTVGKTIIGERGSNTPVSYNHHAFTYLPETANRFFRFALPISIHDTSSGTSSNGNQPSFYNWTKSVINIYQVNGKAIELLKSISLAERDRSGTSYQTSPSLDGTRVILSDTKAWVLQQNELIKTDY